MHDAIRIDKYLWFVRLTKTRGLAQAIVTTGRMRASGRLIERSHALVHVGEVLTFPLNGRVRIIRIDAIPERRGPAPEARMCYTDLSPTTEPARPDT